MIPWENFLALAVLIVCATWLGLKLGDRVGRK